MLRDSDRGTGGDSLTAMFPGVRGWSPYPGESPEVVTMAWRQRKPTVDLNDGKSRRSRVLLIVAPREGTVTVYLWARHAELLPAITSLKPVRQVRVTDSTWGGRRA